MSSATTDIQPLADPVGWLCKQIDTNKGLKARLRRAKQVDDVLGIEAVVRLADAFAHSRLWLDAEIDTDSYAATLAMLLAQRSVDCEDTASGGGLSVAARFGQTDGDRRKLSDLRFSRLIHAQTLESRLRQLRRALPLLDGKVPARHMANAWQQLNSASGRHRFARDYFLGNNSQHAGNASNQPVVTTGTADTLSTSPMQQELLP